MASHRPKGRGFEFRVNVNGIKRSKTFATLAEGRRWSRLTEATLLQCPRESAAPSSLVLIEAIQRYRVEVTAHHKGASQENGRLDLLTREPFAALPFTQITPDMVRTYRDRLARHGNSPNTIRVKLALLSALYRHAIAEWGYTGENPVQQVRKPAAGKARHRRLSVDEEVRLMKAAQQAHNRSLAPLIAFALETGMRRSELLTLRWGDLLEGEGVVRLKDSKNGQPRWIPLSEKAKQVLNAQRSAQHPCPFPVSASCLENAWEHILVRAGLTDLRFHDLRHEALSRWAHKLNGDVFKLSLVSGHRTLQMAQRYVHPVLSELLLRTKVP